ncbi:hypothetical protein pEaSNUABM23_00117 [Erwinia phage pEa_SNUABM_23]|uniref:KTSC and Metallopeptidase-like N-terminal fusion domain-containing protein n=1 Tax=Erwinia phage pEa_SNUABM_3 TaxID=2869552 RepID=A0AAE7XJ53_9CAUD|nr:hypothetical protein MPK68_gp118 [Erwinia phage pEa_SNUABM_3]QZE56315.1 hypothetical protein pEaSNUABM3_00118 [Erwinia phage pEa_SNUABM_3]QZE56654.1 hypothetical protein pEaSNUABM20_00118 [Erwinia phage pEa_SNUABM_20]UAW52899.1 hypothetical protein pEaSNUABM23_00117 [Erwinia phage pEa_SNUABM_23]UIW10795.1 hypothetical protein pEaSNUABM23_00117 [Erwinia phage pEa_SNUABM_31]
MNLIQKQHRVIRDLSIMPLTIRQLGDAFVGLSSNNVAYAWRNGEIYDFTAGSDIAFPSLNANIIERISGMHFAGTHEDTGNTVFMSSSSAVHVQLGPKRKPYAVASSFDLMPAVMDFAVALSNTGKALEIASESAGARTYSTYQGKKVVVDDANDEYDLELEKGDKYSMVYLNRDRYELRLKDEPKIVFIIRGHLRAANIIGQTEFTKAYGTIADDKANTFQPVGVIGRNMATPIQIKKDTVIYSYRKKHYLPQNLAVPLEKILSGADLAKVIDGLKPVKENKAIVKGKLVGVKLPPLSGGTKVPSERPIKKNVEVVYGAFFPVSASQPNRSRIVFGKTVKEVQTKAVEAVNRMAVPTDYYLFSTTTSDELYDIAKGGSVLIRATGVLQHTYANAKHVSLGYMDNQTELRDPVKVDVPELRIAAIKPNTQEVVKEVLRLLTEGYFNTGLHLSVRQPPEAISFEGTFDPRTRDQLTGIARRIAAYLKQNGVEMERGMIRAAFGQKRAELRFNLPTVSGAALQSVNKIQTDEPTLNAPIYATIKPKQPTVEITAFNRHTGYVTIRAQRGPELYSEPYDTLYSNVERKAF